MPETSLEAEERAQEKQQAADRAVEYVQSGMVVGLGAGSTAIFATRRIGQLLREGRLRDIIGFPCSSLIEGPRHSTGRHRTGLGGGGLHLRLEPVRRPHG